MKPAQIIREVLAGLAASSLEIGLSISLAFVVFAGPFEAFLPRAVGLAIIGAGLATVFLAVPTRVPGVIGGQQDTPAVVLAAAVAGLGGVVDPDRAEETVFAFVMVVGLLVAVMFVVVGRFRLATAARSLPFPVISGFLAGTGWILARAGVEIMTGEELSWSTVPDLFLWDTLRHWLPGLALAAIVIGFGSRFGRGLLFPVGLLVLGFGVHIIGRLGWSADALRDNNWLLGPFPESRGWSPVTPAEVFDADWGAMVEQAIPVAGVVGVALISMMLNVAGLEVQLGEDVEVEYEATAAGYSSAAVSLLSGYPSYHQISGTVMARTIGSRSALASVTIMAVCAVVGFAGADLVGQFPRLVAGGVLVTVGLSMLVDWIRQLQTRLRMVDGLLSAVILGSIVAFGVLTGIGVGLLAAVLGFVYSYSRVDPVRRIHRLGSSRSVVDRSSEDLDTLLASAEVMVAIELVGYLFFGSIRKVTDLVSPMLDRGELDHLVIDLTAVRGLDASVVQGLHNVQRRTDAADVALHWSGLSAEWKAELLRGGLRVDHVHSDLDHALEFIEDEVLGASDAGDASSGDMTLVELVEGWCDEIEFAAGATLIEAGDAATELFLISKGYVTAWGTSGEGAPVRFRRVGPGGVIGEVAFVNGGSRSASVVADSDTLVHRLSLESWHQMGLQDPALALRVQTELTNRIAERLAYTSAAYSRAMRT